MEMIKQYSIYIYIPLISLIVAFLVVLLARLIRFLKHLKEMSPKFESISKGLENLSAKSERVAQSKDSYSFMFAILALFGLAKDVRRNRRNNNSLNASLVKAVVKNSGSLKNLRV
ncbi:MAG: hypothetical protein J6Z03_01120 [Erysipelotrichaceae bacterium]|nr:hypothetical protein [Erysipelotrichaceae bacterium]